MVTISQHADPRLIEQSLIDIMRSGQAIRAGEYSSDDPRASEGAGTQEENLNQHWNLGILGVAEITPAPNYDGVIVSTWGERRQYDGHFVPITHGTPGSDQVPRRTTSTHTMSRPPIGAFWGWTQVAMARNATEALVRGTALVLSPHPDDETIGCGLLLAQKARHGHRTSVIVATDGERGWYSSAPRPAPEDIVQIRHREWHRALDALHVREANRFKLGFPDGTLCDHEREIAKRIGDLLRELSPSQVFVTKPHDAHPDHQALARATRRALIAVYRSSTAGESNSSPAVYNYRVYPGEGIWPDGRPSQPTLVGTLRQFARSAIGLSRRRPLALRAPSVRSNKTVAIEGYESQRNLLDGELRYVWRTRVELYWKTDLSEFDD